MVREAGFPREPKFAVRHGAPPVPFFVLYRNEKRRPADESPRAADLLSGTGQSTGCTVGPNSGCIVFTDAVVRELTSPTTPPTYGTKAYTLSGSIVFTPTCQFGSAGCDYSFPNMDAVGSGTFSLDDGTTNIDSGTWTSSYYSYDSPYLFSYTDGSGQSTTCASAAVRTLYIVLYFFGTSSSWRTNYTEIRTDTTGSGPYQNMVYMNFASPPTLGNHHSDLTGVTLSC